MDSSISSIDLRTLLDAIRSAEVVENRVRLLKELQDLDVNEKTMVNSVMESLVVLWEDFTCLDASQCKLNRSILNVAAKYMECDISSCLVQFLVLGAKASMWCRKHLKMTLMSTEDSQEEEHSSFFYQLISDLLRYSAAGYLVLARYAVSIGKEFVASLENFVSEQFTLIKHLICEGEIVGPETFKEAQVALDAASRLCKVYLNGVKWDSSSYGNTICQSMTDDKETEYRDFAVHITKCVVEKLCELGTAAAAGGSLVGLLNMSWKGVVALLQCGKGALAEKLNIEAVILNLISLARDSLGCAAANSWTSSSDKEKISLAEAKRIFLPVKFYLINAVRIISQYPTVALLVYKEIVLCVIMVLTLRISLSAMEHLNSISLALVEILEPTSLHLFNSLMNSSQLKPESKTRILDWLFDEGNDLCSEVEGTIINNLCFPDVLFSACSDGATRNEKLISLGRVALFINLLSCAPDLEDDFKLGIARKLGWLLDILVEEEIYSCILVLHFPMLYGPEKKQEMSYQPMFCALLDSLKVFMVAAFSSPAWVEVESFLMENMFHPFFLCSDVVTELWCFLLRHAESNLVKDVIDKLCMILKLAYHDSVLHSESLLRKTAGLISTLATYGPTLIADQVYCSIFDDVVISKHASTTLVALLMEGFPLNSLSENIRDTAKQRIITQYYDFLERVEGILTTGSDVGGTYGAPVFAMCAALESHQVNLSNSDMRTLKVLVAVIQKYRTAQENGVRDSCRPILCELLGIVSNMKHLYSSDEMEQVLLELQNLFISKPAATSQDTQLFTCKANLASFMAGLAHVTFSEDEEGRRAVNSAAWDLYHVLLRELHWALVHLSITAFGYFAAHTSCNELWRFVPDDAALAFDLDSGNNADEDRFMCELKSVLEKEMASPSILATPENVAMLMNEIRIMKQKLKRDNPLCHTMEVDQETSCKKRKFPDGISRGVEMVQSGLKMMGDGISQWRQQQQDRHEVHELFLSHYSRLQDAIAHLVSLAETGQ